jgi:hypothetical protein
MRQAKGQAKHGWKVDQAKGICHIDLPSEERLSISMELTSVAM